jgi:hypothetical protein
MDKIKNLLELYGEDDIEQNSIPVPPTPINKFVVTEKILILPKSIRVDATYRFYLGLDINKNNTIRCQTILNIKIPLKYVKTYPKDIDYQVKKYHKTKSGHTSIVLVRLEIDTMVEPLEFWGYYRMYLKKFR